MPQKRNILILVKNIGTRMPQKRNMLIRASQIFMWNLVQQEGMWAPFFSSMWAPIVENKYMFGEIIGLSICYKFHLFEKFLTTCSELIQAMVTYWGFDLLGETQTNFNRSKIQRRNIFFQANETGMSTSLMAACTKPSTCMGRDGGPMHYQS
jgi:hypothetical protein